MYNQVLKSSVFGDCNKKEKDSLSRQFRNTVGSIITLFDLLSTTVLKLLFPALSDTIDVTLEPLKSLLNVPEDKNTPIWLLHLSFREFLVNPERCRARDFWIDQKKSHQDLVEQCLHLMSNNLKRNICQLETPGIPRRQIDNTLLNQLLPSQLQYACQYWVSHLQKGVFSASDAMRVYVFL